MWRADLSLQGCVSGHGPRLGNRGFNALEFGDTDREDPRRPEPRSRVRRLERVPLDRSRHLRGVSHVRDVSWWRALQ